MLATEAPPATTLSPHHLRSGIAAWLGWFFDGLDMHLFTLVAMAFVAELMGTQESDPAVARNASFIQAAFLIGWAIGGAFFGRIGDIVGRSRALVLTILTYAGFTGLSYFAQSWEQLTACRFLSALGIGGEWAVGAALLAESWPKTWRPWIAATLQSAVNFGILLACFAGNLNAGHDPRNVFLVGLLPAFVTLWIRRAVPETEEWTTARKDRVLPGISELFSPAVRSTTWRVLVICAVSLTAHWSFMFWQTKHITSLPEIHLLPKVGKDHAIVIGLIWLSVGSLFGNYLAGALAKLLGYRTAIAAMLAAYGILMIITFSTPWSWQATKLLFAALGACQGAFGLFTMCLPPLFPVLLRTTGAGFCYNAGRIFAAAGTVFFGIFNTVDDVSRALLYAGFLFIPATLITLLLPLEKSSPIPSPATL